MGLSLENTFIIKIANIIEVKRPNIKGPIQPKKDHPIPKTIGEILWLNLINVLFIAITIALFELGASDVIWLFTKGNDIPCAIPKTKIGNVSSQIF